MRLCVVILLVLCGVAQAEWSTEQVGLHLEYMEGVSVQVESVNTRMGVVESELESLASQLRGVLFLLMVVGTGVGFIFGLLTWLLVRVCLRQSIFL